MIWDKQRDALRRGESLVGYFAVAGGAASVPGVLRWSAEDGAQLELVDGCPDWPQLGDPSYTVHGELRDGADITLLGSWTKAVALAEHVTRICASTIALGERTTPDETFPRAIYATANLRDWRDQSGLTRERLGDGFPPEGVRVEWRRPARVDVALPGMSLALVGDADTVFSREPHWTIETHQRLVADPARPFTVEQAWRTVASPLLNLTSFASDRPDQIIREVLVDVEGRRRIEVWRQGTQRRSGLRPASDRYLFYADDLSDLVAGIQRWWALDDRLRPALGLFAEHISQGRSYSPARFLTLFTAMEAYCREQLGQKDFKRMRKFAEVPDAAHGCDLAQLRLIGASRNYFAHLSTPDPAFTPEDVEAEQVMTIRRAHALMQACLLREVGFPAASAEELLAERYEMWPLA